MSRFLNFVKTAQQQFFRGYAFKSDLKIKWVRPEKISCIKPEKSGDLSKLPQLNEQEILPDYKDSKELQTADDMVQSLFRLSNNPSYLTTRYFRQQMIKEVQRHPLDYGSMEAKLAKMTVTIRRYQEHMERMPRDKYIKVRLKELIDKRKKFLKYLRRWDYKRFEWMLEKLDLVYKPPPTHFHWITRKESLQKLTDEHCAQIRANRLEEYHQKLKAQQIPFLEEAIKKMEFVRREQIECDVPVTVSEADIEATRKELEVLKTKQAEEEAIASQKRDKESF